MQDLGLIGYECNKYIIRAKTFPHWKKYGYELIDVSVLFERAYLSYACGQDSWHATFTCQPQDGMPWKIMNGGGVDKGALLG